MKVVFADMGGAEPCVCRLTSEMVGEMSRAIDATEEEPYAIGREIGETGQGLWHAFHQQVADTTLKLLMLSLRCGNTCNTRILVERRTHFCGGDRTATTIVSLQHVVMKYLCTPGPSAPAERLVRKAGNVVILV